jgi:hypothetical protein
MITAYNHEQISDNKQEAVEELLAEQLVGIYSRLVSRFFFVGKNITLKNGFGAKKLLVII